MSEAFDVDIPQVRSAARSLSGVAQAVAGFSVHGMAASVAAAMPGSRAAQSAPQLETVRQQWVDGWSRDLQQHASALSESAAAYVKQDEESAAAMRQINPGPAQVGSGPSRPQAGGASSSASGGKQDRPW